jgi:hypothetical protein
MPASQPGNTGLEYLSNVIRTAKGREVIGSCPNSYMISTTVPIKPFTSLISVHKLEESITLVLIHICKVFARLSASSSDAFAAFRPGLIAVNILTSTFWAVRD